MKKKILILSYWYQPEKVARAFHVKGIVSAMLKKGYEVELLLPQNEVFKKTEFDNTSNLKLHFIRPGYIFHREKNRWDINQNIFEGANKNLFYKSLKFLYNAIIWPDRTIEWALSAYLYVKKNKILEKCDSLITIGLPLSTHITGSWVKRKHPNINWIADYGDPFTYNPDRKIRKYDHLFESIIIKDLDHLVIPTKNAVSSYTKLGLDREKVNIIPQLFEEESYESNYFIDENMFNIMYAGSFYKGIRSPVELIYGLIEAHKQNPKILLHYFGNIIALKEFINSEGIDLEDLPIIVNTFKDRREIINIMGKMNLLINLNNNSTSQIPSKIIDYLYANKPILNIGTPLNEVFENAANERDDITLKLLDMSISPNNDFNYSSIKNMYSYEINSKKYVDLVNL